MVTTLAQTSIGWIAYDEFNAVFLLSTDIGQTWVQFSSTPANAGRITLAVGTPGDAIVYAVVEDLSTGLQLDVFKSTDGGNTWNALGCNANGVPTNPIAGLQTDLDFTHDQAWYNQMLLVDPADSTRNTVYIGGNLAAGKSTDGGQTWAVLTTWISPEYYGLPYVHADHHYGIFLSPPPGAAGSTRLLVFGTDGGLFTSADGGNSFSQALNAGLTPQLAQYITASAISPEQYYIGLQDMGTRWRTGPNSTSWQVSSGGDGEACGISQANAAVIINSYIYDYFFCSFDGGKTFYDGSCDVGLIAGEDFPFKTNLETPSATSDPSGTHFFTYSLQTVYMSSVVAGSITWQAIGTNGKTAGLSATTIQESLHAIGVGTLQQIAVCKPSAVAVSTNGGASWLETSLATTSVSTSWLYSSSPLWVAGTIYVGTSDTSSQAVRVAKSTNAGLTWQAASTGLPDVPVTKLAVDRYNYAIYAGTWLGVYASTDGGTS